MQDQIKYMVDRFLGWKLPESFNPDAGISYTRLSYQKSADTMPSGTNLFDAAQAYVMVCYMLEGSPLAAPASQDATREALELLQLQQRGRARAFRILDSKREVSDPTTLAMADAYEECGNELQAILASPARADRAATADESAKP